MDAPLDPHTLESLRRVNGSQGGPLLDQVVRLALELLPEHLEGLRQHQAKGAWGEVGRLAHSLKGTGGSFGAHGLSACAKVLEEAAKAEDGARADLALRALESEAARVQAALLALQSS